VVLLLGSSVLIQGTAIYLASSDPSFAVVPDYERKAAEWDREAQLRRESDALGWSAEVETGAGARRGDVIVSIALRDRLGNPVEGASVSVEMLHHARASNVLSEILPESAAAGVYERTVALRRPGRWEFHLTARRGDELFLKTLDQSVVFGG